MITMKITRRQLRRLISEAYRTGIPYRNPIDQSDTTIARQYPQFADKITAVDPKQREAFKLALDPNRPEADITIRAIDDPRFGVTQRQINDLVDEFFSYNPQAFAGAMSQGGMTMRQIAEEIFDHLLTGGGVGYEVLYKDDSNINYSDIEEVVRRYEDALSRPHHKQLGHIS